MSNTDIWKVKQDLQVSDHMISTRLTDSLFSKDLAPHYMKLAGQLAASEIVPKCYRNKPADLFLCWAKGYQLGISPEQAMDCISVINGKAVMWGDEMLALCMSHPEFEDIIENPIVKNDAVIGYTCIVKRKGKADKENVFTLEMAKKAGLLAKGGVWNQYPERMLKLRARGFALRDAFPDALKGIKSREEVEDYIIDADYSPKPSRTEQLKQDIIDKQGANNVDVLYGVAATEEHKVAIETDSQDQEHPEEDGACVTAAQLHTQIKELITERGFAEDRLAKALAYYEVSSIDELSIDAAGNFIEKLMKL